MNEESPGHHADLAAGFAAGSRLGGYRLEEQVGAGGMAVVFRARDERLDRLVALKIMTPAMGSDDMFRQRFIRESRAAAAVDDPHIIPVYEAGEVGHVLFIAMRFVRGGDVRSLLRREGPLSAERVASIVSPVASALDAAHAVGLVHRDVKPANILLDRRPGRPDHVYLSDFGLSKSAEVSLGLTAAGQFLGTPDYTAPEQIEGLPVDGRTDQYALACAVFELLTGQAPFHRSESFAAIWAHLNKPPPSLTERRPELPPATDLVMAKALAKAQVDRYQTCWEFADALRDALGLPPYHLGSVSDPGLSRGGSSPGPEALHGGALSPSPVLPPAPGPDPADAGEGVPPPGEDTEASAVYAARSSSAKRDEGQPALERQASASTSTPDEQATDPGLQVIPRDPASVQEDEPGAPASEPAAAPAAGGRRPGARCPGPEAAAREPAAPAGRSPPAPGARQRPGPGPRARRRPGPRSPRPGPRRPPRPGPQRPGPGSGARRRPGPRAPRGPGPGARRRPGPGAAARLTQAASSPRQLAEHSAQPSEQRPQPACHSTPPVRPATHSAGHTVQAAPRPGKTARRDPARTAATTAPGRLFSAYRSRRPGGGGDGRDPHDRPDQQLPGQPGQPARGRLGLLHPLRPSAAGDPVVRGVQPGRQDTGRRGDRRPEDRPEDRAAGQRHHLSVGCEEHKGDRDPQPRRRGGGVQP